MSDVIPDPEKPGQPYRAGAPLTPEEICYTERAYPDEKQMRTGGPGPTIPHLWHTLASPTRVWEECAGCGRQRNERLAPA